MEAKTISEALRSVIGDREITRAFFTTYSFEPAFFELEVLPLLMGAPPLSNHEATRYFQLQNLMSAPDNRLQVAVMYDQSVFEPTLAPRLEVQYLPITAGADCQHAKLIVLSVTDRNTAKTSLVLAAGSFNLTRAGWWDNLEVGHWVELDSDYAPQNVLQPLRVALAYYQSQGNCDLISGLLAQAKQLPGTQDDPDCYFYFSGPRAHRQDFDDFMRQHTRPGSPLEVISPYFAEVSDQPVICAFLARHRSASVLLPLDENKRAMVDQDFYETLPDEQIRWASWNASVRKRYLDGLPYRRLHAKIYHSPGRNGWLFVGSVNLSAKAFLHNVEAGFLLKGRKTSALLAPLQQEPEHFVIEEEAAVVEEQGAGGLPAIHANFDWRTKILSLHSAKAGTLVLLNSESKEVLRARLDGKQARRLWPPPVQTAEHKATLDAFVAQLQRSSLFHVRWLAQGKRGTGLLVVSQLNLYCKPQSLPSLDLQTQLQLFLGMDESRRLSVIGDLARRRAREQDMEEGDDEGDLVPEQRSEDRKFFSAFALVNGAFWTLTERLKRAEKNGEAKTLHYYLQGQQPDSLRALLQAAEETQRTADTVSLVVHYLSLLSAKEILDRFSDHADPELGHLMSQRIASLERQELLPLLGATATLSNGDEGSASGQFLAWFKENFNEPVDVLIHSHRAGERCETN